MASQENASSLQITAQGSRVSWCIKWPASGHQGRVCLDAGLVGQTAPREASGAGVDVEVPVVGRTAVPGKTLTLADPPCAEKWAWDAGLDSGATGAVTGTFGVDALPLWLVWQPQARMVGPSEAQPESAPRLVPGHHHKREREPSLLPSTRSRTRAPASSALPWGSSSGHSHPHGSQGPLWAACASTCFAGRMGGDRTWQPRPPPPGSRPARLSSLGLHGEGRGTWPSFTAKEIQSRDTIIFYFLIVDFSTQEKQVKTW